MKALSLKGNPSSCERIHDALRAILLGVGLLLALASRIHAANEPPVYTPDSKIEQTIEQTAQADKTAAQEAVVRLAGFGTEGEQALQWHLLKETSTLGRMRYAELLARCAPGKVGYRVMLDLKPDGTGNLTLWSDRALLAACGKKYARILGQPEPVFNDEALRFNPYSKVELIKNLGEGIKFLEAHVEQRGQSIEATGLLAFKAFDALSDFAEHFDVGGYQMLYGTSLTDSPSGQRTYRFKKAVEQDPQRYQEFLLLFHDVKWEFVLTFGGQVQKSNATAADGNKLTWSFNCYQMLNGNALMEMSYDAGTQAPRSAARNDSGSILPMADNQPVAVPSQKAIMAKVYNLVLTADELRARSKDLREQGYVIVLDGHESRPAGAALQYQWVQTSGLDLALPVAKLAAQKVSFVIRQAGEYHFNLTVALNGVSSKPADVRVIVELAPPPGVNSPSVTYSHPSDAAANTPPNSTANAQQPLPANPGFSSAPDKVVSTPKPPTPISAPPVAPVEKIKTVETAPPPRSPPAQNPGNTQAPVAARTDTPATAKVEAPKVAAPPLPPKTEAPATAQDATSPSPAGTVKPLPSDPVKAKELHAKAVTLMKAGQYPDAKGLLNNAVALNPSDMECQFDLALAQMESGDLSEALSKFEEVQAATNDPKAIMNVGHCYSRSGRLREAGAWYRRGTEIGKEQVAWEPEWQLGNNYLRENDFSGALDRLTAAEKSADAANVKDYRLLRDLAVAFHGVHQDQEAAKRLSALQALGYTPDPKLLSEVAKGTGEVNPAAQVAKVPSTPTDPGPQNPAKEIVPIKVETSKPPAVAVSKGPQPNKENVNAVKAPEPLKPLVSNDEPKHIDAPEKPAKTIPTVSEQKPDPRVAVVRKPVLNPISDPAKVVMPVPVPVEPKKKKPDPKPLPPKKPLPPIPNNFDDAMAAGKRAYDTGVKFSEQKTEDALLKANDNWDEAEAMFRGAWARKPGDEEVLKAFQDLSKYTGAIALVKDPLVKAKIRGLVVLDAEASIVPKDRPLYCVWVQVAGEDLTLRPENLTQKKLGLRITNPGTYKFELAVSDGQRGGNPVTVTVVVEEGTSPK